MAAKMMKKMKNRVSTKLSTTEHFDFLSRFIGSQQLNAMRYGLRSDDKSFFKDKVHQLHDIITTMPAIMETDGQRDAAIAYLHYFSGSMDWYVTERDDLHVAQSQAFGLISSLDLEKGYINISELTASGKVELDLHWTPCPLSEIIAKKEETRKNEDDASMTI